MISLQKVIQAYSSFDIGQIILWNQNGRSRQLRGQFSRFALIGFGAFMGFSGAIKNFRRI